MTDDNNDVLFQKKGGKIIHIPTGEIIEFVRVHGVYFLELRFDHDLRQPKTDDPTNAKPDFGSGLGA